MRSIRPRPLTVVGVTLAIVCVLAGAASVFGEPIQVLSTLHFRDLRSPNTVGAIPGDRLSFGGDFTPNPSTGDPGTTVLAFQGSVAVPVPYIESLAAPNFFNNSVPYTPALTGSWTLVVQNPASSNSPVIANTPTVGVATNVAFVSGFSLIGAGPTPTFNWTLPTFGHDTQGVSIWNLDDQTSIGLARNIHSENLPQNATSYTVPAVLSSGLSLELGTHYAVGISLQDRRPDGSLLSRSIAVFDFLVQASAPNNPIFLPSVGPDGVYHFNIPGVGAEQMIFIDPPVAIGYDYEIGLGDPNFASVLLPTGIGDNNLYDLWLFDGSGNPFDTEIDLVGGEPFNFGPGGVSRFRILGIEAEAALDPADVTAFVTGLTFTGPGSFTGTQTPITQEVPQPAALLLLVSGLVILARTRIRLHNPDCR